MLYILYICYSKLTHYLQFTHYLIDYFCLYIFSHMYLGTYLRYEPIPIASVRVDVAPAAVLRVEELVPEVEEAGYGVDEVDLVAAVVGVGGGGARGGGHQVCLYIQAFFSFIPPCVPQR